MDARKIAGMRLINQQIAGTKFKKPSEVVKWLCAMQAQEYAMAKWAIGLRLGNTTDKKVDDAFNRGKILRTHILRPTWHFVSPDDIRWLIDLTAPRVNAANAFMYRKFELDDRVFRRTNSILSKMLGGGKHLTREELNAEFERQRIKAKGLRLGYIFMRAELDGLICSGPRKGKQFTYALLEERVPMAKPLKTEESLNVLAHRYFSSRGPATIRDFVNWSGLTVRDAKTGIASLGNEFLREKDGVVEYIFKDVPDKSREPMATFLMPDYDEYGMSYKDRSALLPRRREVIKKLKESSGYTHWLVINGVIEGAWTKSTKGKEVVAEATPFRKLNVMESGELKKALKLFHSFAGSE